MRRSRLNELRMLVAERLILLALTLTPKDHPHAAIMARHLGAMAAEMDARLVADRCLAGKS